MKTKRLLALFLLLLLLPTCMAESTYVSDKDGEGGFTAARLYEINGQLLLERNMYYENSMYCYDAAVLLPNPAYDPDKDVQTFEAVIRRFSGFSLAGAYWEDEHAVVSVSKDSSITFIADDGTIEKYRYTGDDLIHPAESYPDFSNWIYTDEELIGEWSNDTLYMEFTADRRFICVSENETEPPEVYFGLYAINDGKQLTVSAQRLGYGNMPYDTCLDYAVEGDTLSVIDLYDGLICGNYTLSRIR